MPDHAALDRAAAIQRQFEEQFAADPNVVGIGIGLNAAENGPALNVQVTQRPAVGQLPDHFDGLEVIVIVVGAVSPQDGI